MILCDTGPLVAAFNTADRDHDRCAGFLRENWSRLVVPSLAVTEVCHLPGRASRRAAMQGTRIIRTDIDTGRAQQTLEADYLPVDA